MFARRAMTVPLLIASLLMLAGCAASSPAAKTVPLHSGISSEQRSAMKDGKVDRDEYLAGFRRYSACVADKGFKVEKLGDDNEVITYRVAGDGVKASDDCYNLEFYEVDRTWQLSREDTSPDAAAYSACLTAHHITPEPTYAGMMSQLVKANIEPADCLRQYQQ